MSTTIVLCLESGVEGVEVIREWSWAVACNILTDNSYQLKTTISSLNPTHFDLTFNTEDVVKALKKTKTHSAPGFADFNTL